MIAIPICYIIIAPSTILTNIVIITSVTTITIITMITITIAMITSMIAMIMLREWFLSNLQPVVLPEVPHGPSPPHP